MAGTIKEVAKLAGVSYQAVSAVLNGNLGKASEATRGRIFAAAEKLHYRPNRVARGLVSGKTGLIGFVAQDIHSPYYADLTYLIQLEADRRELRLLLMESNWDDERTLKSLADVASYSIDGLLLISNVLPVARERNLIPPELPVVLVDNAPEECSSVGFDYRSGMESAFELLLARGQERIRLVHDPINLPKHRCYLECCRKYGVNPEESCYVSPSVGGEESLVELGRSIAGAELPDALLVAADYDAALILRGLLESGIRIPEQLSIISIDDTLVSRITSPPLTTIRLDRARMAELALDELIRRIDDPSAPQSSKLIPTELVVRKSVRGN